MKRLKIAVYTMAKNEANHVARYVETTRDADLVVVTDTGSTDGTPDLLSQAGVQVHTSQIMPWRFDIATNCALCHVPEDVDVCVKLDLDEVLTTCDGSPWRNEIERLWTGNIHQLRYWYNWSWHVTGVVPAVRFRAAHVHSRRGFVWRHAGHAGLYSTEKGTAADANQFEIHHYMVSKGRPNYLSLLQLAVRENRCPRTLFYLGREYSFKRMDTECVNTLNEYLVHPDSQWKAERAGAMRYIALSYERMGQKDQAICWLIRGQSEYPGTREMWWELLRCFTVQGDYAGGYWAGTRCLAIPNRDPQWNADNDGRAWREEPFLLTAQCAWNIGHLDEARDFLRYAYQMNNQNKAITEFAKVMEITL